MSSTDEQRRTLLFNYFEENIKNKTACKDQILGSPNDSTESYYIERDEGCFPKARFELEFSDQHEIEVTLNEYWANGPYSGLGTSLMKLSEHFKDVEENDEVSSFVYEMF